MAGMTIEDIILTGSKRGMHLVRPELDEDYCRRAAKALLQCPRGTVGITTGFWVDGRAETDGPPGAYFLARGLEAIGFDPVIISDQWCLHVFDDWDLPCFEVNGNSALSDWIYFSEGFSPVALISVERCGRNASGCYANMFGSNLNEYTAPIDEWFEAANDAVITIGIGDGGNEIGMGNIAAAITRELDIEPCVTQVDHLIIASVSNWGAFGLLAAIEAAEREKMVPAHQEYQECLNHIVSLGAVDGVTGRNESSVDGHPIETDLRLLDRLYSLRPYSLRQE